MRKADKQAVQLMLRTPPKGDETMNEENATKQPTNATNYLTTQKTEENQKIENLRTGVSPAILI
jgi:hypothetical protein